MKIKSIKRHTAETTIKEKASASIEAIFSQAVALDQSGRLKNTIYAIKKRIFIKNSDNTVLLSFISPDGSFQNPISFKANDYEGTRFYEKEGKIVFETQENGYTKEKSCVSPGKTPQEMKELFESFDVLERNKISFHSGVISFLNDSLSHTEISIQNGEWVLTQRDIYSGSISQIKKQKSGLNINTDTVKGSWGPLGIRTSDFIALFAFQDHLDFYLNSDSEYIYVSGTRWNMKGIIATCLYDEMGTIKYQKKEK